MKRPELLTFATVLGLVEPTSVLFSRLRSKSEVAGCLDLKLPT